jgi:hypothetical protein
MLERLSPVSYRLDLPEGSCIHDVVSILHLKEFKGSGEDIRPLPVMVDGTEEWEVIHSFIHIITLALDLDQ